MFREQNVTDWLDAHTDLHWRSDGTAKDAAKMDGIYLDRSDGDEIKSFILRYFKKHNIAHCAENYENTFNKIMAYQPNKKVKMEDVYNHLAQVH